jgi:hypothetical protein
MKIWALQWRNFVSEQKDYLILKAALLHRISPESSNKEQGISAEHWNVTLL